MTDDVNPPNNGYTTTTCPFQGSFAPTSAYKTYAFAKRTIARGHLSIASHTKQKLTSTKICNRADALPSLANRPSYAHLAKQHVCQVVFHYICNRVRISNEWTCMFSMDAHHLLFYSYASRALTLFLA